jgi:NAD(P)-dependent dehydrogenase (short-subunit alcohol dehydrogenase family)
MPVTLITGASRGLGLEFARQYAGSGWQVLACCRCPDHASDLKTLASLYAPGCITLYQLDMACFDQIDALTELLSNQPVDLLINNAGVYPDTDREDTVTVDYDAWIETIRVNAMAPHKMVTTFAGQIARSQQKKIINITSKMGSILDNTTGGSYLYRSSKAALNMIVRSLAVDLAAQQVIVTALHPGWVRTDMGGPDALITVAQSVAGMRQVIRQLTLADSGRFYAYDGSEIAW